MEDDDNRSNDGRPMWDYGLAANIAICIAIILFLGWIFGSSNKPLESGDNPTCIENRSC